MGAEDECPDCGGDGGEWIGTKSSNGALEILVVRAPGGELPIRKLDVDNTPDGIDPSA